MTFVRRQLEALHGADWLKLGCSRFISTWRQRATHNRPTHDTTTLLGYAHLGELKDLIMARNNWPAFEKYFTSKDSISVDLERINNLRVTGMHAGDRAVVVPDALGALAAIHEVAKCYHPPTAELAQNILFQHAEDDVATPPTQVAALILSNLEDFSPPRLIGREAELRQLLEFWRDNFKRVAAVVGHGGVGKTALLDAFTSNLLTGECAPGARPDPEILIYLTAKDNYLPTMTKAPPSRRFRTLHRIYETTLHTIDSSLPSPSADVQGMRTEVLSHARDMRIFFALDNLESLRDEEYEQVALFLADLPSPSKAIITTRIDRLSTHSIRLHGLPATDAIELLRERLESHGLQLSPEDSTVAEKIVSHTGGSPLVIVHVANLVRNGKSFDEIYDQLRGRELREFFDFAYDSSIMKLDHDARAVLLYLALSKSPRQRKDLLPFVASEDRLSSIITELADVMSLIKRTSEEKKRVRFQVDNPALADFVKDRVAKAIDQQQYKEILRLANQSEVQARSANISVEIERAIESAIQKQPDWPACILELERARESWGDDPRLLGRLGYYYFRQERRDKAETLLKAAITAGDESSETFAYLALVLMYEKRYDEGLSRAEDAIAIRGRYEFAEQIAAQCVIGKVHRDSLLLSIDAKLRLLEEGVEHLRRSFYDEDRGPGARAHNERSKRLLDAAHHEIEQLRSLEAS